MKHVLTKLRFIQIRPEYTIVRTVTNIVILRNRGICDLAGRRFSGTRILACSRAVLLRAFSVGSAFNCDVRRLPNGLDLPARREGGMSGWRIALHDPQLGRTSRLEADRVSEDILWRRGCDARQKGMTLKATS